ncbi:unnamed protein product [Echinostoma caproni]|uniref:Uncharacterized protein n=1 Tax=Echinostoma caproni TaxID=27848 RepID=A0A3P8I296_9TREM|nr:unnamed protein product [Echinostoma caproni]
MKLTARFEQWATYELIIQVKHIKEMREVMNTFVPLITSPSEQRQEQQQQKQQQQLEKQQTETQQQPKTQVKMSNESESVPQSCMLLEHTFSNPTNGGTVACFLELMMFEQVVDLKMCINLSDITFLGDRWFDSAVDSYYEKHSKSRSGEIDQSGTTGRDLIAPRNELGTRLVNRSFLSQLHKSPACIADTDFWIESGFNRRARWFDHRMSFAGGQMIAIQWTQSEKVIQPEFSLKAWYEQMLTEVDSVINRVAKIAPRPIGDFYTDEQPRAERDRISAPIVAKPTVVVDDIKSALERYITHGRVVGRTSKEIKIPQNMNAIALIYRLYNQNTYSTFFILSAISEQ